LLDSTFKSTQSVQGGRSHKPQNTPTLNSSELLAFKAPVRGKRVMLEKLVPEHAEYLHTIYQNDAFWASYRLNENRSRNVEEIKQRLLEESRYSPAQMRKCEWVVFRLQNGDKTPIGLAGLLDLVDSQKRAEFLIGIVNTENRLHGIGLEATLCVFDFAFNIQRLNKLVSLIYSNNESAQANTIALGFSKEGELRKHFRNSSTGEYSNIIQNGLLLDEFRRSVRLSSLSQRLLGRDVTLAPVLGDAVASTMPEESQFELHAKFEIRY